MFTSNPLLTEIDLGYNSLTGTLSAATFASNPLLTRINLFRNNLSGSLPATLLVNNTALENLTLADNNFSGNLPAGMIDTNTSLEYFTIGDNIGLNGSIPAGFFDNNPALRTIWMDDCSFSGSIPAGLFTNNTNLRQLFLYNNNFSGAIPANLFDTMTLVDDIRLHANNFSGNLPANLFVNNTALDRLIIRDNNFTGGTSLATNSTLVDFEANNNDLPSHAVDQFLIDLNSHGTSSGSIFLNNQLPSPPGGTGHTAKTALEGRGWSVTVDGGTYTPSVAITSAPDISSSNETNYGISGTCSEDGEEVTLSIGGLTPTQPTCSSGTFSISGFDVSSLGDGSILITADHIGASGNAAPQDTASDLASSRAAYD